MSRKGKKKRMFLLDVVRERLTYPALKQLVLTHMEKWDARQVLIEDKASGIQLVQELHSQNWRVIGVQCEGDKVMRLLAQTAWIESGAVMFPKEAPWLAAYLNELLSFPRSKHADQVDSTAQAIKQVMTEIEWATELKVTWAR